MKKGILFVGLAIEAMLVSLALAAEPNIAAAKVATPKPAKNIIYVCTAFCTNGTPQNGYAFDTYKVISGIGKTYDKAIDYLKRACPNPLRSPFQWRCRIPRSTRIRSSMAAGIARSST